MIERNLRHTCVLGDLDWSVPGPGGAVISRADIRSSAEFFYMGDPAEMPMVTVMFTKDTERRVWLDLTHAANSFSDSCCQGKLCAPYQGCPALRLRGSVGRRNRGEGCPFPEVCSCVSTCKSKLPYLCDYEVCVPKPRPCQSCWSGAAQILQNPFGWCTRMARLWCVWPRRLEVELLHLPCVMFAMQSICVKAVFG